MNRSRSRGRATRRARYGTVVIPTTAATINASEAAMAVASRFPWSRKMVEYSAAPKAMASPASARKNRSHACESICRKSLGFA
jgi:hypothetical protein